MEQNRCHGCMQLKTETVCPHCGWSDGMTIAPHLLPPGTLLQDKYEIGRVLGQGGFGITYLGWDQILEIPVAIKEYYPTGVVTRECSQTTTVSLLRDDDRSEYEENRARFLREARTLARLEDVPEVVQVKTFFQENGTAYIVMGYVRGITLQKYIQNRGGRLSAQETFALLQPVIRALDRVHRIGLVHRDISPDNIMIQSNGMPRLIDFGAAHKSSRESDMKSTQAVLKYGFAPMEQYQRKGNLGPWTDVYAMCATIYYCLTGKTPPHATDRIMGEDEFDWNIPGLTPQQRLALENGVALHVKDRVQSMEELENRLFGQQPIAAAVPQNAYHQNQASAYRHDPFGESSPASYTVPLVSYQQRGNDTAPVQAYGEPFTQPINREAPQEYARPYGYSNRPGTWEAPVRPLPETGFTPAPKTTAKAVDIQSLIDRPVPQQKPQGFDSAYPKQEETFWKKPKYTAKPNGASIQDLINNPTPWQQTQQQPQTECGQAPNPNASKRDLQSLIDNPVPYQTGKKYR